MCQGIQKTYAVHSFLSATWSGGGLSKPLVLQSVSATDPVLLLVEKMIRTGFLPCSKVAEGELELQQALETVWETWGKE